MVPKGGSLAHLIASLSQPAIRADKEAAIRGFGQDLREGLRIEADCCNRLLTDPDSKQQFMEGLRRFNERDHPDRVEGQSRTPGIVRA